MQVRLAEKNGLLTGKLSLRLWFHQSNNSEFSSRSLNVRTRIRGIGAPHRRGDERLLLIPPVPSRDVVAAARGADAGIWTLPALCRNFTMRSLNKIFEYLAADLPVLVAPLARMDASREWQKRSFPSMTPRLENRLTRWRFQTEGFAR
jgi:hypothetical protein